MNRPEFIDSLEAAAKAGKRAETDYGQRIIRRMADQALFDSAAQPEPILELIRYVQILERAFDRRVRNSDPPQHVESQTAAYLEQAERELFPEKES